MSVGKLTPGINVFAKIDGKTVGPLYLVQIEGDKATLQGLKTHVVPLSALSDTPTPDGKEVV
jgi:hypothetical protein